MLSDAMAFKLEPDETLALTPATERFYGYHVDYHLCLQPRHPDEILNTSELLLDMNDLDHINHLSSLEPEQITPSRHASIINNSNAIDINPRRLSTQTTRIPPITTHQIRKARKVSSVRGYATVTRPSVLSELKFCFVAAFVAFGICKIGVVIGILVEEVGPHVQLSVDAEAGGKWYGRVWCGRILQECIVVISIEEFSDRKRRTGGS